VFWTACGDGRGVIAEQLAARCPAVVAGGHLSTEPAMRSPWLSSPDPILDLKCGSRGHRRGGWLCGAARRGGALSSMATFADANVTDRSPTS